MVGPLWYICLHPRSVLQRWPITEERGYGDLIANLALTAAVLVVFTDIRQASRIPLVPNQARKLPITTGQIDRNVMVINAPARGADNQEDGFEAGVPCHKSFQVTGYPILNRRKKRQSCNSCSSCRVQTLPRSSGLNVSNFFIFGVFGPSIYYERRSRPLRCTCMTCF